ncbi:hypothetical protein [Aquisphaera insulae]|uniref:hypothetical protein n=1 Tax=Aquisphaera insulae TaxID=2712864 RepID=UPI0013EAF410|nr:hypothetical protein [Aquisphaera insulae]
MAPPPRRAVASRPRWLIAAIAAVLLCGTLRAPGACAQDPPAAAPAAKVDAPAPSASTSLARYVPKDNLLFHLNFDGLDAHAEAWQKTAAYKMLTTTPLGAMLEEVAAQLLDRAMENASSKRLTGAEVVTLLETIAHKGFSFSLNVPQVKGSPGAAMVVFRGLAAKENRLLTSKALGSLMGAERPRTERRKGRFVVLLNESGSAWWAEKEDIVIGPSKASIDYIIDVVEGKIPSAVDHAVDKQLSQPEESFRPVLTFFVSELGVTDRPLSQLEIFLVNLKEKLGITRLDYRWGFDNDALMSVLRLTAPAPRKPALAMFDQPKLDLKQIMPVPEGVDSFATVSASPEKILQAIAEIGPPGEMRARLDEVMEKLKGQTKLNIEKDLLGNLGPRMMFYMAPGRSAAATDESPKPSADPMAMLSSLQSVFPKPTLVAELRDPVAFTRALESVVIAVNKELKAMAVEKAAAMSAEDANANNTPNGPEGGRGRGGAAEGAGRRKSNKETPAPELRLSPGPVKTYMLIVPPDSPIKLNLPGVRPTIRLEGKYIAISTTSEAARVALEAVKKKEWKPTPDVAQALDHAPANSILVAVDDSRSTTPAILASLPGTLQTQINTIIAMGAAQPGQPGQPQGGSPGAPANAGAPPAVPGGSNFGNRKLGRLGQGGPNAEGFDPGGQPPPAGYPGAGGSQGAPMSQSYPGMGRQPQPGGGNNGNATAPAMIEIKVDPAKLPRAEDLKALMFPGTMSVSVDDQAIKLVSRESFPNLVAGLAAGSAGTAMLMPAVQAARRAAQEAAARKAAAAGEGGQTPPNGQAPGAGFPGARPNSPQGPGGRPGAPASPGGRGGGGRRGEGPVD